MRFVRLGWTITVRGWRSSIGRTAAMAVGMAAAGFVAAAILGIPGVFDGRNARAATVSVTDEPSSDVLALQIEDDLGDRTLARILIAGTGAPPPGLDQIPGPGELVWSPALADLATSDRLVAHRFPQSPIGLIDAAGLIEPGELRVYVGVDTATVDLFPAAFGVRQVEPVTGSNEAVPAMVGAGIFLALPAGAFLATSARLSARARDRRLASLRLLGLSRRAVRTINSAETAVIAIVGAAIGVAAWSIAQESIARRGIGGFRWFATDAPVGLGRALLIVAAGAVAAIAVATTASIDPIERPLESRRAHEPTVRLAWRAAVLSAGILTLALAAQRQSADSTMLTYLLVGGALSALGATLATPVISRVAGDLLARRNAGALRLLTGRRLRHDPTTAGRVVAGVLAATFALGTAHGVIGAFNDVAPDISGEAMLPISTNLGRNSLDHLPGLKDAIPAREIDGIYTYAATCDQLETILAQPLTNCPDGQPFDLQFAGQLNGAADTTVPVVEYDSVPGESYSFAGRVVPPHTVDMSSARHWDVRIDPTSRSEFIAELMRADPTARLQIWSGGNELATMVLALVVAGAIAAFVLGFGAVIVATADRALDRRKLDALQLATGVPTKLLRRVQFLTVAIPTTLTVTLAAALGTVTGHLYRTTGTDDDIAFPWPAALSTTAAGLIGVACAASLAYLLAQTRVDPANLRSE